MAIALVGLFSCKKENLDDQNQNQTPTDTTSHGGEPAAVNPFLGSWDMMFVEGATVHMTVTFSESLRTIMTLAGQEAPDDMDQDVSMEGTLLGFVVEEGSGNQLNVIGSMTVNLGMGDPVTFSFNTTATYANGTMSIAPAEISETITVANAVPIDLTGTITFTQPTAAPVEDNLSIELATMSINGSGTLTYQGMSIANAVAVTVEGTNLPANGTRAEE